MHSFHYTALAVGQAVLRQRRKATSTSCVLDHFSSAKNPTCKLQPVGLFHLRHPIYLTNLANEPNMRVYSTSRAIEVLLAVQLVIPPQTDRHPNMTKTQLTPQPNPTLTSTAALQDGQRMQNAGYLRGELLRATRGRSANLLCDCATRFSNASVQALGVGRALKQVGYLRGRLLRMTRGGCISLSDGRRIDVGGPGDERAAQGGM